MAGVLEDPEELNERNFLRHSGGWYHERGPSEVWRASWRLWGYGVLVTCTKLTNTLRMVFHLFLGTPRVEIKCWKAPTCPKRCGRSGCMLGLGPTDAYRVKAPHFRIAKRCDFSCFETHTLPAKPANLEELRSQKFLHCVVD